MATRKTRKLVALVGRPNVGKSTLFNVLTGHRKALVEDTPGLTRDRHYAEVTIDDKSFTIVDTGGLEPTTDDIILSRMRLQTEVAIEQADIIVFLGDGKVGVTPSDHEIVRLLAKTDKRTFYTVNKIDSEKREDETADFYALGIEPIYPISARTGFGMNDFLDDLLAEIPPAVPTSDETETDQAGPLRIAVVGRPNVGKSTLINLLLGEERMIANPQPGTTRDAIDTVVRHYGREYVLIDTAGIRRRSRIVDKVEKYSVIKAFQSIDRAEIVLVLLDATELVTEQDARIAGYAYEKGRGVILVLNKWDLVPKDHTTFKKVEQDVKGSLKYLDHAPVISISAKTGVRAVKLFGLIEKVETAYRKRVSTAELNRFLASVTESNRPGMHKKTKQIKLFYLTQIKTAPPTFMFFCNYPESIHFSYRRFLENRIRDAFDFGPAPLKLVFKKRRSETDGARPHKTRSAR